MGELIDRISAQVGIGRELADKAVSIILNFLNDAAPPDKMAKLLESLPEARDAITSEGGSGGGTFGGMMGAMGAMSALSEAGLSMDQIRGVTKETVVYAKEKAGADTVDDLIGSIPGLSQFV
ncbi:MAG: DUF2267 domain-containing protein [Hyphomicrobiales bacterium]|nr:DUF2267 domain-containing protein [Hyphomicrobiales bacterium]